MPSRLAAIVFAVSAALVPLLSVAVSPVRAHDPVTGMPDVTITVGRGLSDRSVSVRVGGIVRFVNQDDERHRFRSRDGAGFDTGNIDEGESAQIRLSTPGTYAYIDERDDEARAYHGRIVVSGVSADGGTTGPVGASGTASAAIVTIVDEAFIPATTRVKVGGSVTFENQDGD
jgi:plastocyanin